MPLVPEQLVPVLQPPPPQQATGPEVPLAGLPEPDHTPAVDLDKSNWQIVSNNYKSIGGVFYYNVIYYNYKNNIYWLFDIYNLY